MSSDAFQLLGLTAKGVTESAVRKAYAAKLKQIRPDTDPEGFMALRDAYEVARVRARQMEADRAARKEAKRAKSAAPKQVENAAPAPLIDLGSGYQLLDVLPATYRNPEDSAANVPFAEAFPALVEHVNRQPPAEIAIGQVEALVREPWRWQSLDAWREIIDQDDLQSIDDFQDFEWRMRQFVCEQTGFGDREMPALRPWMTDDVMELLDERFGWTRGGSRDGWEQVQFRWLFSIYEEFASFSARRRANQQFTVREVVYAGEQPIFRQHWTFHAVTVLVFGYAFFWVAIRSDLMSMVDDWPKVRAVLYLIGCFMLMTLVVNGTKAIIDLFAETKLLMKRGLPGLKEQPIRQYGDVGWYTTNDWLALIGAIIAIIVIESQYEPATPPVTPAPGVTVMFVPTN